MDRQSAPVIGGAPVQPRYVADLWLAVVLVAAVALRLTLTLVLPYDAPPDERYRYGMMVALYGANHAPRYGSEGGPSFVVKPIFGYRLNAWVAHLIPANLPLFIKFRFGSILLSAVTIVAAYAACRNLWPSRPTLAVTLAAVLAFHPKVLGLAANVNADAYTIFASTLVFYVLTVVHRRGALNALRALALGVAAGMVFLGRDNGYAGFIMIIGYLSWLLWRNWRCNWRSCAMTLAVALVFPTTFYLHQYGVYGKAFIPFVVGSGTMWVPPEFSAAEAYQSAIRTGYEYRLIHLDWRQPLHWVVLLVPLFTSSYVIFSFHPFDVPSLWYSLYFFFFLCSFAGLVRGWPKRWVPASFEGSSRRWLLVSAAVAGVGLFAAVARNNFVVLHQPDGRYLMPLIVPMILFIVLGWRFTFRQARANRFVTLGGTAFFVASGIWSVGALAQWYG